MSRLQPVLKALWRALRREQESLMKFPANNLYYAAIAFLVMLDPFVMMFVGVVAGIVLFFPLSTDPLRRIPPSRFQLWPLQRSERRLLRMLSPWLNPMTWIVAGFALWRGVSLGLGALAAALFLVGFITPSLGFRGRGRSLSFPFRFPGPFSELIRKDLRSLVRTLDFYCALIVAGAAAGYRIAGLLPADAFLPGTLLTLLCISTCAQTLFGLDGRAGLTRYRCYRSRAGTFCWPKISRSSRFPQCLLSPWHLWPGLPEPWRHWPPPVTLLFANVAPKCGGVYSPVLPLRSLNTDSRHGWCGVLRPSLQPTPSCALRRCVVDFPLVGRPRTGAHRDLKSMATYEQLFSNNRRWADSLTRTNPTYFPTWLWSSAPTTSISAVLTAVSLLTKSWAWSPARSSYTATSPTSSPTPTSTQPPSSSTLSPTSRSNTSSSAATTIAEVFRAALQAQDLGILNPWLRNVRDVYRLHRESLNAISDSEARFRRLVELNTLEQCLNVIKTAVVQQSWLTNGFPKVHGWVFDLRTGLIKDLEINFEERLKAIQEIYNLTNIPPFRP